MKSIQVQQKTYCTISYLHVMRNSVSTENTCVKRKHTLTETVKGEKQPHPPLEQWSLPPPPPQAQQSTQYKLLHVGDVTNTIPTSGSAKYPQLTHTHKKALSYHEQTNKRRSPRAACQQIRWQRHYQLSAPAGYKAVRSRGWPVPAASRWRRVACIRSRSRGTDIQKVPGHSSAANRHGRSQ